MLTVGLFQIEGGEELEVYSCLSTSNKKASGMTAKGFK